MTPSEADITAIVPPDMAEVAPVASAPVVHERPAGSLVEFFESLLVTILLALFGTTFIVQAFKIPSESMEPTLLVGDHLLVNKFVFEGTGAWYEKVLPYRPILHGDIIVFKFPFDDHPHYVKRVIGLPGDRIRIVNNQVYVNDQKLAEPYVVHDPSGDDPAIENFPPVGSAHFSSRPAPGMVGRDQALHRRRRAGRPARPLLCHGRQSRPQLG